MDHRTQNPVLRLSQGGVAMSGCGLQQMLQQQLQQRWKTSWN